MNKDEYISDPPLGGSLRPSVPCLCHLVNVPPHHAHMVFNFSQQHAPCVHCTGLRHVGTRDGRVVSAFGGGGHPFGVSK